MSDSSEVANNAGGVIGVAALVAWLIKGRLAKADSLELQITRKLQADLNALSERVNKALDSHRRDLEKLKSYSVETRTIVNERTSKHAYRNASQSTGEYPIADDAPAEPVDPERGHR